MNEKTNINNELNDLFGQVNNAKNNNYKNQNNKNKWKEQNEKRKELYKKISDTSFSIVKDSNSFKAYLNVLSRFYKYSVGNCMLILESEPNAKQIKSKQDWIDKGYDTLEGAKTITILEPNNSNGTTYYNPKEEYDISQTNAPIPEEKNYTEREILFALFDICTAEREIVDTLPNGEKGSQYVESENKLYMCRGLKPEYLIKTVIQEIAKMEMKGIEQSEINEFKTYCISYMMCKKYGIDVTEFEFSDLPKELVNQKDSKNIRQELEGIRENFATLSTKVNEYFIKEEKAKNNKEQGR